MNDVKQRKVFSLNNFRGLDKESKPLKVEPFRAADGTNFLIDSNTLKTRPSFSLKKHPGFVLENNEYIIDWYQFQNMYIYVTNKHFRFEDEISGIAFHEKTEGLSSAIIAPLTTFDFEGKHPFFHEEKQCLFIFGLEGVFVFSIIKDFDGDVAKYVFYELNNKPSNPLDVDSDYFQDYEDLPKPYEPTLFIGDNRFDDVNLLSSVSKYKLFSSAPENATGSDVIYRLPTHYNKEKHGDFTTYFDMYKGRFENKEALPVFMGREGEDFATLTGNGDVLNAATPIKIKEEFFPVKDWEYFGTAATPEDDLLVISEMLDLDKNWFFNARINVLGDEKTIFSYLVEKISLEAADYLTNKIIAFELPVKYNAIFRDQTNNFIVGNEKRTKNILVYAQLKKNVADELWTTSENIITAHESPVTVYDDPYPTPDVPSGTYDYVYDVSDTPIEDYIYDELFKEYALQVLHDHQDVLLADGVAKVQGKFFSTHYNESERTVLLDSLFTWLKTSTYSLTSTQYGVYSSFNTFPSFDNDDGLPVLTPDELLLNDYNSWDVWESRAEDQIKNLIDEYLTESFTDANGGFGWAFAKIKVHSQYKNESGTIIFEAKNYVIKFYYHKGGSVEYQSRQTKVFIADVNTTEKSVFDNLFSLSFNEPENVFELKTKDFFFDYQNEPSIEVKVKFEKNPGYEKVVKNTFGTTFGSENRIFVAGHPEYPNIDRYNVSNDLLGDNDISQSYESTFFPSKNYRVIGGKGAINGYVVATDTVLYVTKEKHRNDERFFIRERLLNEDGIVGYKEYKTNITHTPLNHKCLVRFNNDILMLTEDGLFAIEISNNVLTNERLIKLRSGFINENLKKTIKEFDLNYDAYVVENNHYLYIFIGKTVFVADSRYVAQEKNSLPDNMNYEIVKWTLNLGFRRGHFYDNEFVFLDERGKRLYHLDEKGYDDDVYYRPNEISLYSDISSEIGRNVFQLSSMDEVYQEPDNKEFRFISNGYKYLGEKNIDFTGSYPSYSIVDLSSFAHLSDGDTVYIKTNGGDFIPCVIEGFESSGWTSFTLDTDSTETLDDAYIFQNIQNVALYPSIVFEYYHELEDVWVNYLRLGLTPQEEVSVLTQKPDETYSAYLDRVKLATIKNNDFVFDSQSLLTFYYNKKTPIELFWVSAITDMGNNLMEKTMFRSNVYATKQEESNQILFGYKTMRGLKTLEDGSTVQITQTVDLSNTFDFGGIDFNTFSLNTFNEFGMSFPTKENNFLYIQFLIKAVGSIELNAFEIIYKLNRRLKTIG